MISLQRLIIDFIIIIIIIIIDKKKLKKLKGEGGWFSLYPIFPFLFITSHLISDLLSIEFIIYSYKVILIS